MKLNLRPNHNEREPSKATRKSPICVRNIVIYTSLLYNLFIHIVILVTSSEPPSSSLSLSLLRPAAAAATNHHEPANQYKTSQSISNNSTLPVKDVTNLHLISDFRAVKLRWSYEPNNDKNQPASFDVRFCELTSWNIEIKCRQRNMMVERELLSSDTNGAHNSVLTIKSQATGGGPEHGATVEDKNSVIPSVDTVHQLGPATPNGPATYEAQIFDLRALTNYTFQVQVSRFEHEPPKSTIINTSHNADGKLPLNNRAHSARRLSGAHESMGAEWQHLARRIETKPFGAEATKCLADVSEVLINTGRYFGGRISVEDSNDPRCHLIGNKTSEQSSYLFKIDHSVCASKTVDGKRIETMVLVHENKDILTHNTARFLVLCNFLQKSFTLRASVSLPKVNALLAPPVSRPAVITSLPRYKLAAGVGGGDQDHDDSEAKTTKATSNVMLGSMPGIYRARVPHANTVETSNDQTLKRAATTAKANPSSSSSFDLAAEDDGGGEADGPTISHRPAVNNRQPLDELESNTIERKFVEKKLEHLQRSSLSAEGQTGNPIMAAAAAYAISQQPPAIQLRQPKELGFPASTASDSQASPRQSHSNGAIDGSLRARSPSVAQLLEPDQVNNPQVGGGGSGSNKFLAGPVQVQSKVLYIEREDAAPATRVGRLHEHYLNPQQQQQQQQHSTSNPAEHSSQIDTPGPSRMPTTSALAPMVASPPPPPPPSSPSSHPSSPAFAADRTDDSRQSKQSARAKLMAGNYDQQPADLQAPIIITNNHRIAGDYLPVSQAASSFRVSKLLNSPPMPVPPGINGGGSNNFTIKYSADRVDDFPIGNQDDNLSVDSHKIMGPSLAPSLIMRGRSGRMRSMAADLGPQKPLTAETAATTTTTTPDTIVSDHRQPAWSVQRMGEAFGSDGNNNGDLMDSETSNETTSQMMVVASAANNSLAQNITGAILRWSLKTLTNLARKSLESLINETTTTASPSSPYSEPNGGFAINQASTTLQSFREQPDPMVGANRWLNSGSTPAEPAKRPPSNRTPSTPHVVAIVPTSTASATSRRSPLRAGDTQQVTATTNSELLRPFEERLVANDGFIVSGRQTADSHPVTTKQQPLAGTTTPLVATTMTTTPTTTPHHSHPRPSNYSKSLDLNRNLDPIRHRNTSERIGAGQSRPTNQANQKHNNHHHHKHDENNQSTESLWSQRATALYSSWMFYGILLFVGLVTAIVMIVCLVSTGPRRRSHSRSALDSAGAHNEETARSIRTLGFKRECAGGSLVFGDGGGGGDPGSCQSGDSIHDITYQKYDYNKFENYSSDSSINNRLTGLHVQDNDRHKAMDATTTTTTGSGGSRFSPSVVSHPTRSTSANSSSSALMADENDCKNNEFLYTAEHVLINTGASFGESYA